MDVTCAALDLGGYVGGGGVVELTPLEQVYVASKRENQTSNFNLTDSIYGPPGNLKYLSDTLPPPPVGKISGSAYI